MAKSCEKTLKQLQDVLDKYNALSANERSLGRLLVSLKFATGPVDHVADSRSKITSYISTLSMLLIRITKATVCTIEKKIDRNGGILSDIKIALNRITARSIASDVGEGSVITAYTKDDKDAWDTLRRELKQLGYGGSVIRKHMHTIKAYVKELGDIGALDGFDVDGSKEVLATMTGIKKEDLLVRAGDYRQIGFDDSNISQNDEIAPLDSPPLADSNDLPLRDASTMIPRPPGTSEPLVYIAKSDRLPPVGEQIRAQNGQVVFNRKTQRSDTNQENSNRREAVGRRSKAVEHKHDKQQHRSKIKSSKVHSPEQCDQESHESGSQPMNLRVKASSSTDQPGSIHRPYENAFPDTCSALQSDTDQNQNPYNMRCLTSVPSATSLFGQDIQPTATITDVTTLSGRKWSLDFSGSKEKEEVDLILTRFQSHIATISQIRAPDFDMVAEKWSTSSLTWKSEDLYERLTDLYHVTTKAQDVLNKLGRVLSVDDLLDEGNVFDLRRSDTVCTSFALLLDNFDNYSEFYKSRLESAFGCVVELVEEVGPISGEVLDQLYCRFGQYEARSISTWLDESADAIHWSFWTDIAWPEFDACDTEEERAA